MTLQTILSLIIIGLAAGVLSGFMGVGGGVVMIPLMVFFLGYSQHQAQGLSLAVLAMLVTLPAAYTYYVNPVEGEAAFNWKFAGVIAISFLIGGYLGSKFAVNIPQQILKKSFAVILIIVAIKMFFSK